MSMRHAWVLTSGACLVGAVFSGAGSAASSPEKPQAESVNILRQLAADWRQAYDNEDWARAITLGQRLVQEVPGNAGHAYNLACACARGGRVDEAVAALRVSAERGWSYTAMLLRDADLDAIRSHVDYPAVLALVRENNARAHEEFKKTADRHEVLEFASTKIRTGIPAPLIVAMHGYGGTAAEFARLWRTVAEDAGAVLSVPQGSGRTPSGGYHWGRVEDGEYLVLRAIDRAHEKFTIDPRNIVLTGFSQGGGMAFTVALRNPLRVTGVIPICGFYDHAFAAVPEVRSGVLPRFFIMNGARDDEAENNRWAAGLLRAAGAGVQLRIYEKVGHSLPPQHEEELREALEFVLVE